LFSSSIIKLVLRSAQNTLRSALYQTATHSDDHAWDKHVWDAQAYDHQVCSRQDSSHNACAYPGGDPAAPKVSKGF